MNFEREFRLKRRNHNKSLFLSSKGVKDNRRILLCKKKGGAAETGACHTCGRRLATYANEYCDGRSFDAIFNVLDGEAAPGIHDSGVRDI